MPTAAPPAGYAGREVTQPPTWHGLVVWDVFLNALATGLFLAAAIGELARPALFVPVAVWVYPVALVVLLADLSCLVFDLGTPSRFHHMLRVFKPLSPMSLGTWCLTAYSLPLTLLVAVDLATLLGWWSGESAVGGWGRVGLLCVALPFAFGSAAYKGVLFSTTAQPGWRDARWLGAYHTSGALVFGAAGMLLVSVFTRNHAAIEALRPALGVLTVLNAIPFGLLARDLGKTFPRGARARFVAAGLVGGAILPLVALLIGGGPGEVTAVLLILTSGFAVRGAVVRLPHAVHHT